MADNYDERPPSCSDGNPCHHLRTVRDVVVELREIARHASEEQATILRDLALQVVRHDAERIRVETSLETLVKDLRDLESKKESDQKKMEDRLDKLEARLTDLEKTINKWGAWLVAIGLGGAIVWNITGFVFSNFVKAG